MFVCHNCNFTSKDKKDYSKHLDTTKHKQHMSLDVYSTYNCEKCNYLTLNKYLFEKHLLTIKHNSIPKEKNIKCDKCIATFSSRQSLSRHKKKCNIHQTTAEYTNNNNNSDNNNTDTLCVTISETQPAKTETYAAITSTTTTENNMISVDKDMLTQLVKQNQEFQTLLLEQHKELAEKIEELSKVKSNVTINNNFNLSVFLNEYCKDALNINEFANSIQISLKDLEYVGMYGYVEGMTKILLNGLKQLDLYKRPLHCTDIKREVIHIKGDDNQWDTDNEHQKVKHLICKVANKNVSMVSKWQEANPEYEDFDSRMYKLWSKIIKESINVGKHSDRNDKFVLHNLAKSVYLDRKKLGEQIKKYCK